MRDENDRQERNVGPERVDELRAGRGRIGEGMDSPDSTEVPLDASTGEPDRRVQQGRSAESGEDSLEGPNTRAPDRDI